MRNPIRRSRKIGKTQGGRVSNGRAHEKWSRLFPENNWKKISRDDKIWQFYVENPSRDYFHPCTPEDYLDVLERLPVRHTKDIKGVILRRTTKQDIKFGREASRRYSCVVLNAFPRNMTYIFSTKPSPLTITHYEKYASKWIEVESEWHLKWDEAGVRKYYLYHLFLHEIGHVYDRYRRTTKTKKENYAESFARDMAEWLDK